MSNKNSQKMTTLLHERIDLTAKLAKPLEKMSSFEQKISYLRSQISFEVIDMLPDLSKEEQYVLLSLAAIGQKDRVFGSLDTFQDKFSILKKLANDLLPIEKFYNHIGGVIGYHLETLRLIYSHLVEQTAQKPEEQEFEILEPPYVDIRTCTHEVEGFVSKGLDSLEKLAEIYVVGGAGDRLDLKDEYTQLALPVARLEFCGKSLLEGLFRDLEAREYLYFKKTGKEVCTPVVLMTSQEKRNTQEILLLCEQSKWFGRPQSSFFFVVQPLVPVVTITGDWLVTFPCELVLKPGGHGVIWSLAKQEGAFSWLKSQGRKYCIVRQINNPIAGRDYNLLALAGYGESNLKRFGFESCPRKQKLAEGMNVLKAYKTGDAKKRRYTISNVEYTEFERRSKTHPEFANILESDKFCANTNILYADIDALCEATLKLPIPGLVVNVRNAHEEVPYVRLESTMQNIADAMGDVQELAPTKEELSTFVLMNERSKTISVTKKSFDGINVLETPEGCFYDIMKENRRLLCEYCHFDCHEMNSIEDYLEVGPSVLFLYHPALGPLYQDIAKKVSMGVLHPMAEVQLEISEAFLSHLSVHGSLLITATHPLRSKAGQYSEHVGKARFKNVTIENRGIDRKAVNCYSKNKIERLECVHIILEGDAEFVAENVRFYGNKIIRVPAGKRGVAVQRVGGVDIILEDI
jgi:hypothetical protein